MSEIGRCMKCKSQQKMVETERVTMKNGRPAMKGQCSKCSTKMFKILPGSASKKTSSKKSNKSTKKGSKRTKKSHSKKSKKKTSKKGSRRRSRKLHK